MSWQLTTQRTIVAYLHSSISASTTRSRRAALAARESLGIGAWRGGDETVRRRLAGGILQARTGRRCSTASSERRREDGARRALVCSQARLYVLCRMDRGRSGMRTRIHSSILGLNNKQMLIPVVIRVWTIDPIYTGSRFSRTMHVTDHVL
jgi:hypothetical protein